MIKNFKPFVLQLSENPTEEEEERKDIKARWVEDISRKSPSEYN